MPLPIPVHTGTDNMKPERTSVLVTFVLGTYPMYDSSGEKLVLQTGKPNVIVSDHHSCFIPWIGHLV